MSKCWSDKVNFQVDDVSYGVFYDVNMYDALDKLSEDNFEEVEEIEVATARRLSSAYNNFDTLQNTIIRLGNELILKNGELPDMVKEAWDLLEQIAKEQED